MGKVIFRKVLVGVMLMLVAFPIIQDTTHLLHSAHLKGAIQEPIYSPFSWEKWWSGKYQDSIAEYAKAKTGMRADLVRLANQADYSLFHIMHANGVWAGEQGYLYESGYIERYCGTVRLPYSTWCEQMHRLRRVQDTLEHLGIHLLVVQAGSKATFYPEYFPPDKRCDHRPVNDHDYLNHLVDSLHIHYIDFNNWFLSMKGRTEAPLFTRQGIHWSQYGAAIAADSMVRYMKYTDGTEVPAMTVTKGKLYFVPWRTDADIFEGLNLIQRPERDTFYNPDIKYDQAVSAKPKMIFIADSYMWTWMLLQVPHHISSDWEFWYYNHQIYDTHVGYKTMDNYDWLASVTRSKYVIFLFSECNIENIGMGFVDKAYDHFYVSAGTDSIQ